MRAPIYFDGSNDGLSLPNLPSVGNFTVSFWVFPTVQENTAIFAWDNFPTTPRYALIYKPDRGNIEFDFWVDDAGNGVAITNDPPLNKWAHIAMVRNGDTCGLYINGVNESNITATGKSTTTFTAENVRLGCHYFSAANNEFFVGGLQHVTMWDHALTPAQIVQLSKGQNANTVGIRPRWHLDGYGQKVTDYSPLAVTDIDVPVIAQYGNAPVRKIPKTFAFADVPSDSHLVPIKQQASTRVLGNPKVTLKDKWLDRLYVALEVQVDGTGIARWVPQNDADFSNEDAPITMSVGTAKGTHIKGGIPALDCDGTNTYIIDPASTSSIVTSEAFTMVWVGETFWNGTDREAIFGNGTFAPAVYMGADGGTGRTGWGAYWSGWYGVDDPKPAANGRLTTVVFRRFAGASGNWELWVDGQLIIAQTGRNNSLNGNNLSIGGSGSSGQEGNSKCAYFALYKGRTLSVNDIQEMTVNPWSMFKDEALWTLHNEAVADLATFEMDHTDMPWSPPS